MAQLLRLARPIAALSRRPIACAATGGGPRGAATNRKLLVSHVLIKDKAKTQLLDELESQLAAGATFGELALRHSECPSSKREGQLGWLARGSYLPEFEEAAFSQGKGGIARASTSQGLHLIKVMDVREEVSVEQMDVQQLAEMLGNPGLSEDVQFVDVREEWEYNTARLPQFKLFPLSKFEQWRSTVATELDPQKETVVLCHHGVRSQQMAQFLVSNSFTDVKNVTGGIHAYSSRVDPSVPVY